MLQIHRLTFISVPGRRAGVRRNERGAEQLGRLSCHGGKGRTVYEADIISVVAEAGRPECFADNCESASLSRIGGAGGAGGARDVEINERLIRSWRRSQAARNVQPTLR